MDGPLSYSMAHAPQSRAVRRLICIGLIATWFVSAEARVSDPATDAAHHDVDSARITGLIRDTRLREISGIAASRRHADLLWVHNDSGYPAQVHAIDMRGRHRATLDIDGTRALDFEDISAFELDGIAYLLIADTGDNGGRRSEVELVVLAEPERIEDARVQPAWTQRFRWPDGPRDVEAVAVDAAAREVLLIAKKRVPPELLTLPLGRTSSTQTARRVGALAGIEAPSAAELAGNPRFGRYRAQITGADLSSDGRMLAVLNYRSAYLYARADGEAWAQAVSRAPRPMSFGWLAQAEAIAFDPSANNLWITSERLPAPLIQLTVPKFARP